MKIKDRVLNVLAIIIVAAVALETGWATYNSPRNTLLGIAVITAIYYVGWLVVWAFRRVWGLLPEKPSLPTHAAGVAAIITITTMLVMANVGKAQQQNYSSGGYSYGTYNYTPTYSYNQGSSFGMNMNANYDYSYQTWSQMVGSVLSDPFNWLMSIGRVSHMFDHSEDPAARMHASRPAFGPKNQ